MQTGKSVMRPWGSFRHSDPIRNVYLLGLVFPEVKKVPHVPSSRCASPGSFLTNLNLLKEVS